jgi:hypothetical protein
MRHIHVHPNITIKINETETSLELSKFNQCGFSAAKLSQIHAVFELTPLDFVKVFDFKSNMQIND